MIYISTSRPHETTWKLKEPKPTYNRGSISGYEFPDVRSLAADGDELSYIRFRFSSIPISNPTIYEGSWFDSKLVIWRGEMAQFIYDNLI